MEVDARGVSRFHKHPGLFLFVRFIVHSNSFIMLYLNKQNTQFIIALNSYLTAVLLIPQQLKFHSSYFRLK